MSDFLLTLRRRTDDGPVETSETWPAAKTALVLCDIWDRHWCRSAAMRLEAMVERMAAVVEACRQRGALIVHAPSDTMEFYESHPARLRALAAPRVELAPWLPAPPLPIDDSDSGCDDEPQCPTAWVWTRQHAAIRIDPERDVITDDGGRLLGLMGERGIDRVLLMGVHTNMCVLHRTFALKTLAANAVPAALVRDLTDTMYNPRRSPFVPHDEGTRRVVEYIERHVAASVESVELLTG